MERRPARRPGGRVLTRRLRRQVYAFFIARNNARAENVTMAKKSDGADQNHGQPPASRKIARDRLSKRHGNRQPDRDRPFAGVLDDHGIFTGFLDVLAEAILVSRIGGRQCIVSSVLTDQFQFRPADQFRARLAVSESLEAAFHVRRLTINRTAPSATPSAGSW